MSAFLKRRSLKILYKNFLAHSSNFSGLGIRRYFMKKLKRLKFLLMIFLLNGCSAEDQNTVVFEEENVIIETQRSYDEITDYELVWENIFDVDSENYYVYFYSTTCSHCQEMKNYMIGKALERKDIYFIKGSSKDQITNDLKNQKYAENPEDIWILGYPTLIKIVSKKCIKYCTGTSQIKAELN